MDNKQIIEIIADKYRDIMDILQINVREDNKNTPQRVAKLLVDMCVNENRPIELLDRQMSCFENPQDGGRVEIKDIPFNSLCSHHHFPFFGLAKVSYLPDKKIIGLSKIPRVIKWFSKRPQLQERLTKQIGEYLVNLLDPLELKVELYDCIHTCMLCRGIESQGKTLTRYYYIKED